MLHLRVRIGLKYLYKAFLDSVVAVGHANPDGRHGKAEYFDLTTSSWASITDYPYADSYYDYAVLFHESSFYYFGGSDGHKSIVQLDAETYEWHLVGALNTIRWGHRKGFYLFLF